jgi:DNA polymerase-3 subunit epsilon
MDYRALGLKRPLVIFDLETTGTEIGKDRIVEIALIKIHPDGSVLRKPDKRGKENRILVNPEMPIPREASEVHGIWDADVENAHTFGKIAPGLFRLLEGCDLGGFNSNRFDVPMLAEEFLRVGIDFGIEGRNLIDVQNIFHKMEQRTLRAGYLFYCGKQLDDAHEALPDAEATLEILMAQLERYKDHTVLDSRGSTVGPIPQDMESLHDFCRQHRFADLAGRFVYNEEEEVIFHFGQHKGRRVKDVLRENPGYYGWMMDADFPQYTKRVLRLVRESMGGERGG